MIEKAQDNLWETISSQSRLYKLRETNYSEQTELAIIRFKAREIAEESDKPVHIDAYYEGQWYEMDVAYPKLYSATYQLDDIQHPPSKSHNRCSSRSNSTHCPKRGSLNTSKNDVGACHCWECHHSWSID